MMQVVLGTMMEGRMLARRGEHLPTHTLGVQAL